MGPSAQQPAVTGPAPPGQQVGDLPRGEGQPVEAHSAETNPSPKAHSAEGERGEGFDDGGQQQAKSGELCHIVILSPVVNMFSNSLLAV